MQCSAVSNINNKEPSRSSRQQSYGFIPTFYTNFCIFLDNTKKTIINYADFTRLILLLYGFAPCVFSLDT